MSRTRLALGGLAFLIFLLLLSSGMYVFSPAGEPDGSEPEDSLSTRQMKKWTFLVYMAADNNLEAYGIDDLNEMEEIGSNENVNIIVQVDRADGLHVTDPDWTNTRRYYITKDTTEDITSTLIEDMPEQSMTRKDTFKAFFEWGITDYPAEHYALIIWDHGEGLTRGSYDPGPIGTRYGFCKDYKSPTPGSPGSLQIWDLEATFNELKAEGKFDGKIDVIGFDICYGGFFEYAYQLKDNVDYYVGSFDEVPEPGWDYSVPLSTLKANPDIEPKTYAMKISDYYRDTYERDKFNYLTIATVDVQGFVTGLLPSMNELAHQLALGSYHNIGDIAAARQATEDVYGLNGYATKKYADLYHFCENLIAQENIPLVIKSAANGVMLNYSKAVLVNHHQNSATTNHNNNHGPGIFLPLKDGSKAVPGHYMTYALSRTVWGEFLTQYYSPLTTIYTPIKDTESTSHSPTLKVEVHSASGIKVVKIFSDKHGAEVVAKKLDNLTYEAVLDPKPVGTTANYYLEIKDIYDISYIIPPGAKAYPETYGLSYSVGTDTTPPTIYHIPPGSYKAMGGGISIYARMSDNLGIDPATARVHYREMEVGGSEPFTNAAMSKVTAGDVKWKSIYGQSASPDEIFVGKVPEQPLGTILEYYFTVSDASAAKGSARSPSAGSYEMSISGSKGPIMFDSYYGSLIGYQELKAMAVDKGYQTQDLTTALGFGDLAQTRVLVIIEPTRSITGDELVELKGFLGSGGDMLVIGSSTSMAASNTFLDFAGLELKSAPSTEQTITNPLPHELLEGVTSIKLGASSIQITAPNTTVHDEILRSSTDALVLANTSYGDGKVLASSDKLFDDTYLSQECNNCLAGNILFWLSQNLDPVAVITAPSVTPTDSTFTLSAGGSLDPDGNIVNYTWDMGDSSGAKYGRSVTHRYSSRGVYKIKLIVIDNEGGVGISTHQISVNSAPASSFNVVSTGLVSGAEVEFESTATDPDGLILSVHWDFGDGNFSNNATPVHIYEFAGSYSVTLWVLDDMGLNDTFSKMINVRGEIDNITVRVRTDQGEYKILQSQGMTTILDEAGSVYTGLINATEEYLVEFELLEFSSKTDVNYSWTFGDGSADKYGKVVHHAYLAQGVVPVFLFLKNIDGATGNSWIYINVHNVIPAPSIKVLEEDGSIITFSAGDSIDTPNEVLFYQWRFGDGTTQNTNESEVTYDYNTSGTFKVKVEVFDDEGAFGSDETTVVIKDRDFTVLILLFIFGGTAVCLAAFVILLTFILKKEKKPQVGSWAGSDPNMLYYLIGAAVSLVLGILIFGIGMVYIISLGGDIGGTEMLIGRTAVIIIAGIALLASSIYIFIRNRDKGHTYISRIPFKKAAKKVDKAIKGAKLTFDKSADLETVYSMKGFDVRLKVVRVLDQANEDIGTMFVLTGRDFKTIERLKEALQKKF